MTGLEKIQAEICAVGKLLYDKGYVVGQDGNLSVRTGENEIWVTPSGVSKGRMTPDMLLCTDLDGTPLSGTRHPTSELKMHLAVYRARRDICAVVHAHPPLATAFSICRKPLKLEYLAEQVVSLGTVPVAPYATLSTDEVPQSILPYLNDCKAILLANHGVLTWGADLYSAFDRMESVEHIAHVNRYVQQLGGGVALTAKQIVELQSLQPMYLQFSNFRKEDAP